MSGNEHGCLLLLAVRSLPQALLERISGRSHCRRSVRGLAVEEGLPASACMRSCFRIFHGNALSLCIDVMQFMRDCGETKNPRLCQGCVWSRFSFHVGNVLLVDEMINHMSVCAPLHGKQRSCVVSVRFCWSYIFDHCRRSAFRTRIRTSRASSR